jgi:hypothetical protein
MKATARSLRSFNNFQNTESRSIPNGMHGMLALLMIFCWARNWPGEAKLRFLKWKTTAQKKTNPYHVHIVFKEGYLVQALQH